MGMVAEKWFLKEVRFNETRKSVLACFTVLGGNSACVDFTAAVERAHSYRARSASKEDTWLLPS